MEKRARARSQVIIARHTLIISRRTKFESQKFPSLFLFSFFLVFLLGGDAQHMRPFRSPSCTEEICRPHRLPVTNDPHSHFVITFSVRPRDGNCSSAVQHPSTYLSYCPPLQLTSSRRPLWSLFSCHTSHPFIPPSSC
jgi:hypothetical protein